MSHLTIYEEDQPATPIVDTGDAGRVANGLGEAGIRFERWEASRILPPDADNDAIIGAYRPEIDRLVNERGYQTFDVGGTKGARIRFERDLSIRRDARAAAQRLP